MKNELYNKSILITGGTGSFGKAFVRYLLNLKKKDAPRRIVVFSRDELKQFEMAKDISQEKYSNIRYFLGDVRDKPRLNIALADIDYVVHAAALKQVSISEYNPMEFIKTNVIGAQNLIETAYLNGVSKVIALSTDKASSPINLYGATKLCSDKLFVSANNLKSGFKKKLTSFSVVRYGNVFGSRGSVVPAFLKQIEKNQLEITNKDMTRFSITLKKSIEFVYECMFKSYGGEIFVPKIPSYKLLDLAAAISKKCKIRIVGTRPGEKIHEELISEHESEITYDVKTHLVIISEPSLGKIYLKNGAKKQKINESYNSSQNKVFLTTNELKKLIEDYKKQLII
jgi:UDP-N-acetylglucosamine 4,6-dehydratase/5-epimerase